MCKICGKKFHYCFSCGSVEYLQLGYCSKECFQKSEEYLSYKKKIDFLKGSLTNEEKDALWSLWDDGILSEYEYEDDIREMLKNVFF